MKLDPKRDFVVLGPQVNDRTQACVRHTSSNEVRPGLIRTIQEGEAISGAGDLVQLRDAGDGTYDVTVVLGESGSPSEGASHSGPAQVATDEYRDGWTRIFGGRVVGEA